MMLKFTKKNISLAIIFLFLISACSHNPQIAELFSSSSSASELERLKTRADSVTIIRDDFGVPHIYGKTDADAVFGLLFAQAEDDFKRIERNYIWATGRLAEVEGEDALVSDLRARLYMTEDEAKAAYAISPEWLKVLCDAYADGLNYYLAVHPEIKPRLITHFEPWMPMFFSEGSIGGDIEQIPLAGIKAFYHAGTPKNMPVLATASHFNLEEPKGSNGFAISGDLTESGHAMLLINPHTSFYFRGEVHVVSDEGLNAYGAVTWGQFFVYQGFNENTGWMHTSTNLDFIDEFVEDVKEVDGKLMYKYGVEMRPVDVTEVTLKYKDGEGISERIYPMYHTHHGPITHMLDGKWVATKIKWDPVNALQQAYIRTKQKGHKGFRNMMDIRTNSSNNTVYADPEGNIAYYHGNFVPKRQPRFDFSKPVDGSDPDTDWQGAHDVSETITILNPENGWIQNCNSTPFTAADNFSPKKDDYPSYMAPDPENFRGIHAVNVLRGQSDLTLDKLIDIAYDPYLPGFEKLIPGLIDAFDQAGSELSNLKPAIETLRQWDLKTSSDAIAMSLAHHYGMRYGQVGKNPQNLKRMALTNYFGTQSPMQERLEVFAATVAGLNEDFGTWKTTWGEINPFQRLNGDIKQAHDDELPSLAVGMASGRWGALGSFGAKRYPGTKRIYGSSGNSFVAVVEFGEKVSAKTLLAGGQSGDPKSPHFRDQALPYVNKQFKDVAYYKSEVIGRAVRIYHPGS
ncbi:MAG: acyl-homoserine-lactone acylase [Candidatus Azotimanducaceae bacterium]|jgi:acyl-homoserine-lactone acylase